MVQVGGRADLAREPLHAQGLRQVGTEDLDGDVPLMPDVAREVDRGCPALAQLTLDEVSILEGLAEAGEDGGAQNRLLAFRGTANDAPPMRPAATPC